MYLFKMWFVEEEKRSLVLA